VDDCRERGVLLLIDAEWSRLQQAVRVITLAFMAENGRGRGEAVLANTYQMYLKVRKSNSIPFIHPFMITSDHTLVFQDSSRHISDDLQLARELAFPLGAKVVRGAYLLAERAAAIKDNAKCPVHDTKKDTDDSYDRSKNCIQFGIIFPSFRAIEHLLENRAKGQALTALVATHNVFSAAAAVDAVERLGLEREGDSGIHFAQINGMGERVRKSLCK